MNNLNLVLWISLSASFAVGTTWLAVRAIRWAKKGTKTSSMLVAAAFPFPDQPPPQEQVEQEIRIKKDTEAGGPEH